MSSFISKNLSKILQNKDDTEKLYADILDNTSDKTQFSFKNHENNEFIISFKESLNISEKEKDDK
ncbi:TPA: hypothetical protein JBI72_01330 [Legionella pneumophila]|uniref:Uncharacterized protein n=2 Tax=Legionella TaxID=445 RepID=A0A378JCH9_9GAMM|nr:MULTISPECIES: hypothetical protein [Legionella]HAT8891757.1 hypothetical protein [Legionella pneumophila subsp. pneumophila]ABQ55339.1 hypothetical protein LPC_1386 [Legionella pneumophila str. Corby]ADG25272.1 hypothetical protein lpa_02791 [Legionella pneumophila 2300/99 Alcoy]KTD15508.1 hypothetical protein Lgra_0174 [Legionella gratiana]MCK1859706.1 hypothetical protein [Legionella pneumophila]